jgi:hypothetical protein
MVKKTENVEQNMEVVGYHKGALETLIKERAELLKMAGIVEQLINAHVEGLKKQGVDVEKLFAQAQPPAQEGKK